MSKEPIKLKPKKRSKKALPPKKPGDTARIGHNAIRAGTTKNLIAKGRKYYTLAYKPRDMILDHGKGSIVWDLEGKDYVDFGAGIAVSALGHHKQDLIKALTEQADKLWHTSNMFYTEPVVRLAEELVKASKFAKRVFFTNSGAEANEAAIKLARKYAADKGRPPERREIITFTGSFHGRTMATVTATAQPKYHAGFEPLPPGFRYCPFNDFDALTGMVGPNTCAVMLEVVQGEGGITPVAPGFLLHVQNLCHKYDALLILDQVQCGMGRTGKLFSHFAEPGVKPDIVTMAKGLGGGFPIGAALVGDKVEKTFQFGSHGSTFGGNPLACAVARVILKKLQAPEAMKNVRDRGKDLTNTLEAINKQYKVFKEIRGRGLMIGAELMPQWHGKAGEICETARAHGLLMLQAGPNVLRFLPPLTITKDEMQKGVDRLKKTMTAYLARPGAKK